MDDDRLQTITLSDIKHVRFNKRNFKFNEHTNCFEVINGEFTTYEPFKIHNLYEQFSKINPNDKNEILEFINKYGNVGNYDDEKRDISKVYSESYSYWRDKILEMKYSLLLLKIFNSENISYVVKINEEELSTSKNSFIYRLWFESDWRILYENNINTNDTKNLLHIDEQLKYACLSDLQSSIRGNIGKIDFIPIIDLNKEGEPCIRSTINFPSLLSIMYWQLYMKFIENKKHFVCEGCNQTFSWYNHKKNYLCNKCYEHYKYRDRTNKTMKSEHDKFGRRTLYYIDKSRYPYLNEENRLKLQELRSKIMEHSNNKRKKLNEKEYLKWLEEQEKAYMEEVRKYKEEV